MTRMHGFAAVLGECRLETSGPRFSIGSRAGVAARGPDGPSALVCGEIATEGGYLRGDEAASELLALAESGRPGLPDGWFAGCVLGARHASLYTDRLGQQPLYYGRVDGSWLVATELKVFAEVDPSVSLDIDAAAALLAYEQVLGDRTLLAGVRLAPAGSVVTLDLDGGVSVDERWRFRFAAEKIPEAEYVEEFRRRLASAVALSASAPIALSGGLDSRSLLAVLPDGTRPTTVTYGAPGSADRRVARRAAEAAGADHIELDLGPGWVARGAAETVWRAEGAVRCFHSHHLTLRQLAARGFDAVQIGYGGDAYVRGVTGGGRFGDFPDDERGLVEWLHRRRSFGFPDEVASAVLMPDFAQALGGRARVALADCLADEDGDALTRVRQFAVRQEARRKVLPGALLFADDVRPRDPYAAAPVLDLAIRMPEALRCDARLQRLLLAPNRALASLPSPKQGAAPSTSGLARSFLTATAARRRRLRSAFSTGHRGTGIGDYRVDVRLHAGRELYGTLLEEQTLARGQIRGGVVRSMIDEELTGRRRHTFALSVLLTLEIFQRQFLDREAPAVAEASLRVALAS